MDASEIKKCADPSDPNRCQATQTGGKNQCLNLAVPGGRTCLVHGGNMAINRQEKELSNNYRLQRWKGRVQELSTGNDVKSLREEIGILRMILEERLNDCNDSHSLILQSGPLGDLVLKIEKVVVSCHKLEGSMGRLLDKQALIIFAGSVVEIISRHITDGNVLDKISDEILSKIPGGENNESV
jgi:hypothetical protein